MKSTRVKKVTFDNRKKQLTVHYAARQEATIHYGQIGITQNLRQAYSDKETGHRTIVLILADGSTEFMPSDQPLALIKDPEFVLQTHIERLVARIRRELQKKGVSLRYVARQLSTSDNQVQRLLSPSVLNKNLSQLYRIAAILDLEVEVHIKEAA